MIAVGDKAPNLSISEWVQGEPTNLEELRGKVVLVEVFQVNCPGCFLYGLPEAIEIYTKHRSDQFTAIGLATAFEDFNKNNLDNLRKLLTTGEVIGETLEAMKEREWLVENKLRYKIPFPIAMDRFVHGDQQNIDDKILDIVQTEIPNFEKFSYGEQGRIKEQIRSYLAKREIVPETFETYHLSGTPSSLLIDKKGVLRYKHFGPDGHLEKHVRELLQEEFSH